MKINKLHAMVLVALSAASSTAFGVTDVYLCADKTTKTLPAMAAGQTATVDVPVWGYAIDDNNDLLDGCGAQPVTSPGPRLTLPDGETSLIVHLKNNLDEPTSLVITGQYMPESAAGALLAPVKFTDTTGRQRVMSLTAETPPAGATFDYHFNNLKPGTYAYKSGTHMSKQLPMGLSGAMTVDTAAGEAYPGVSYDIDQVVFYSEIDPAINNAVTNNEYGAGKPMTSTIGYRAQYFLVNGQPYDVANQPAPMVIGTTDEKTLLRFVNMAPTTHVPIINNARVNVVAEDGNVYHHARDQYSVVMSAGQTKDAVFAPVNDGEYVIYDGEGSVTNGQNAHGGMLAFLSVGAGAGSNAGAPTTQLVFADTPLNPDSGGTGGATTTSTANMPPITNKDIVTTAMNTAIRINVLANDTDDGMSIAPANVVLQVVTGRTARDTTLTTRRLGVATVMADNSILYQPPVGFQGSDVFKYTVIDANGLESSNGTVRVNVR